MDRQSRFLILRKVRYGEADLILTAISPLGEKISFMARGALKSRKRFGGGILEPLHFVQFTYSAAAEGKLNVLKEAQLISDFAGLRKDYDRLAFALRLAEIVGKISQEGDSGSDFIFNLLGHSLRALEKSERIEVIQLQFYLKLLHQQGVLTAEPWMTPFLKHTMADHAKLDELIKKDGRRIHGLEMLVEQYINSAGLV